MKNIPFTIKEDLPKNKIDYKNLRKMKFNSDILRRFLIEINLSQYGLAEISGYSISHISSRLREGVATKGFLLKIARAITEDIEEFLEYVEAEEVQID